MAEQAKDRRGLKLNPLLLSLNCGFDPPNIKAVEAEFLLMLCTQATVARFAVVSCHARLCEWAEGPFSICWRKAEASRELENNAVKTNGVGIAPLVKSLVVLAAERNDVSQVFLADVVVPPMMRFVIRTFANEAGLRQVGLPIPLFESRPLLGRKIIPVTAVSPEF